MRLIDADRLKAEIMGWCVVTDDLFGMGKYHEREIVLRAIEESPTFHAVPVVRCGECEAYQPTEGGKPFCVVHQIAVCKNDYCSHGAKKANS